MRSVVVKDHASPSKQWTATTPKEKIGRENEATRTIILTSANTGDSEKYHAPPRRSPAPPPPPRPAPN